MNRKWLRRLGIAGGGPLLLVLAVLLVGKYWIVPAVLRHQAALDDAGYLAAMRAEQARAWLWSELQDSLVADLRERFGSGPLIADLETAVVEGRMPATTAADTLLDHYLKKNGHE